MIGQLPVQLPLALGQEDPVQLIRLFDIFILGPVMVWVGLTGRARGSLGVFLMAAGVGTILYNSQGYLQQKQGGL